MPAAKASIHALYSATDEAPPAEYCEQSRNGMLYATKTGIVLRAAARRASALIDCVSERPEPPVTQTACGVSTIVWILCARPHSPAAASWAICCTAPGSGRGV